MSDLQDIQLLHSMKRIRLAEEFLADQYSDQEIRCPMHLCIGQEAIAAGVCLSLDEKDLVYSNHRAHGHYLAKGGSMDEMFAELYGRETGCCGGRGGSMHLIDLDAGFMGATPVVGGTIPLAVGTAWASSLQQTGQVTVSFFGDGCFEEGVMHESLNFAALHKLPIVFVCENNTLSVYTRREDRQPDRPIHKVAEALGLQAYLGNGNDVSEVAHVASEAIHQARSGEGPQFIEFSTYRWREHCGPLFDNELGYRTEDEVDIGTADCPIDKFTEKLAATHSDLTEIVKKMEMEINDEIEDAFQFALTGNLPSPSDAEDKVYA